MKGKSSRERGKMLFLGSEQNIMFSSLSLSFSFFAIFLLRENYSLEGQQCALCVLLITVVKMRATGDGVSL